MKRTKIVFNAESNVQYDALERISADSTIQEAAARMRDKHCGVLRVSGKGATESIISAYDIIANAVASDKMPSRTKVGDIINVRLVSLNFVAPASPAKPEQPKSMPHPRKPGRLAFGAGIKS
jgi:signal-transduction protein with cAMP-binding, CBS, and nucleotidyltransferase domain